MEGELPNSPIRPSMSRGPRLAGAKREALSGYGPLVARVAVAGEGPVLSIRTGGGLWSPSGRPR